MADENVNVTPTPESFGPPAQIPQELRMDHEEPQPDFNTMSPDEIDKRIAEARAAAEAHTEAASSETVVAEPTPVKKAEIQFGDLPEGFDPKSIPDTEDTMPSFGLYFGELSPDEVVNKYDENMQNCSAEEVAALIDDKNPHIQRYLHSRYAALNKNLQVKFMTETLQHLKELKGSVDKALVKDDNDKVARRIKGSGELTGRTAKFQTIAMLHGVKQVYLYNSGFNLVLRPFSISELNAFYRTVAEEGDDFGKDLGQVFFFVMDNMIKSQFMDLLSTAIVTSNLVDWEKPEIFRQAVSIHDYETLVWAITSLLYRAEGIEIPMTCISNKCFFKVDNFNVNLNELRYDIFDNLNEEQIMFARSKKPVTLQQVLEYQKSIPAFHTHMKLQSPKAENIIEYDISVPSMERFLSCGEMIVNSIFAHIKNPKSKKDAVVTDQLLLHVNQMLLPWITKYSINGEQFNNDEGVLETLAHDVHEEYVDEEGKPIFFKDMTDFIRNTKISHFCYAGLKCPACGAMPTTGKVDEFVAIDMQLLFFGLTCRKLQILQ